MIQYTKAYIEGLLDKFMAGTSTLEEEDILSQYFAQANIPAEWEQYRLLFAELEAMKPAEKPKRTWLKWGVAAAAVVAGVLYLAIPSHREGQIEDQPLMVQTDTTTTTPQAKPDTTSLQKEEVLPEQTKKLRLRKPQPTMTDYDKAYALMAQAENERMEAERQLEQAQQEVLEAQLAAYGYIPVMQEDGTIIYINEQTNYIAYEE